MRFSSDKSQHISVFTTLETGYAGTVRDFKNKGFLGRKESLRSIAARFDGVSTRLIGIGMILLANLPRN